MSDIQYFELTPVTRVAPKPGEFVIMNAAILSCGLCGAAIDGMGGGADQICQRCGDALQHGHLRGCVKWDGQ